MRRNQRPSYDYHKHKTPFKDIEDYDYKPKLTDVELRSLECSSVQEAHQTNQSYQNSWLEKLVNNMDEDKFNHAYTDTNARNFTRKSTYISPNIRTAQIPNDNYTRQRSAVSCSSKKNDYTPFSRIPQISSVQQEDYPVSRFRNSDNQRIARTYSSNSQHYRIDRPISLTQAHDKKVPKEVDLNESGQSYGRIKRVQKQKQGNQTISKYETNIGSNLQQLDIPSIRLSTNNDRRERERLSTQTQAVLAGNGKSSDNYFREKRDSKQISMGNFEDASGLKRRSSEYFWSKEDPLKYQKYEYRRKTSEFSDPIINRQTNKQKSCVSSNGAREKSSAEKKYEKQDDCKMEQMAKKLNMVLQNISKKSKMIQSSHQPEENKSVKASSISTSSQILQRRNTEVTQPYEQRYRSYSLAMEEQSRAPVKVEEQVKVMAESRSKQKASQQEQYKYQMMKKSLGMSKHIPHEIILEQSSSQINSQISPRTEYLNRQFKVLFDKLDKNGSGELTKHNCAFENVHDEVKYLFGAIFSRIKYKNERVSFKSFIQECQNIVKEFQFQQLKEVLSKSKNITIFKLNEKDTDSERWNNETNNESETKRSSDRSQVVKKYEFTDQSVKVQKIDNSDYNKSKVQWLPTTKYENLVIQKSQNKRTGISRNSYGTQKQPSLETKDLNRFSNAASSKLPTKLSSQADRLPQNYTQSAQKQKQEQYQRVEKENSNKDGLEKQRQKKDFEKMCENLNNKLNNYLTSISKKNTTTGGHHIPLQFSELSKHWNGNKL